MRITFAIAAVLSLFAVSATGAFADCAPSHMTTASSSQTTTSDNAPMTKIKGQQGS